METPILKRISNTYVLFVRQIRCITLESIGFWETNGLEKLNQINLDRMDLICPCKLTDYIIGKFKPNIYLNTYYLHVICEQNKI